jgi:hypothetical protein
MTFESAQGWLQFAIVLWNTGLTAAIWLRKPGTDAGMAVDRMRVDFDIRINNLVAQIAEIRSHMSHMPDSEELAALEGTVKQIHERTSSLADGMGTVRASLTRIEDYLLRNAHGPK